MAVDDRTMFEIYRESDYNRSYRSIFYTELDEHEREREIAKAANGDTIFSGYVHDAHKDAARERIAAIVDELNALDEDEPPLPVAEIERRLGDVLAPAPGM